MIASAIILKEEFKLNYDSHKIKFEGSLDSYDYTEKNANTENLSDSAIEFSQDAIDSYENMRIVGTCCFKLLEINSDTNTCKIGISNLSHYVYNNFILKMEFLDIAGYIIETKEITLDGITACQFTSFDMTVPDSTYKIIFKSLSYNYYTKDELLFVSYPQALTLSQSLNNKYFNICLYSEDGKNYLYFKKKLEYSKAVIMFHDRNGNIIKSFSLIEDIYDSEVSLDTDILYYSINLIR